jgi:putative nucleotidyltransferase with HDIG domain
LQNFSIKKIALYGFGTTFIAFSITILVALFYLDRFEKLEEKHNFYEESYSSLMEFKYYTERLLTTYDINEETSIWINSREKFEGYFKKIVKNSQISNEDFNNFWKVITQESQKVEVKLKNELFNKKNTQERSLLRRLGEGLNTNKSSDYYIALSDLKNSIDHIKQYAVFLLEELEHIKAKQQNIVLEEIKQVKNTAYIIVLILVIVSISILYIVVSLIAKTEIKLKSSLEDLKLSNAEKELLNQQLLDNYEKTLYALVNMIEERDTYTGGHSQRVADYAVMIASKMGYSDLEQKRIHQAGILHDIGKINIPDSILLKPGKLDMQEYRLIQNHAQNGYDFLKQIPMYSDLANIILYHHEHYDGDGYPTHKSDGDIPLESYILSAADAFDAMTTSRIYKPRKSVKEALDEIKRCASTQFHPEVAKAAEIALKNVSVDENISQSPISSIEMERFSYYYKDQISGVYNEHFLEYTLNKNAYTKEYKYISVFLLHNFTQYNNSYGWKAGDALLKDFSLYLRATFKDSIIFRVHGDDFIVLYKQNNESFKDTSDFESLKGTDVDVIIKKLDLNDEDVATFKELQEKMDL